MFNALMALMSCVKRALPCEVSPALRGVDVDWSDEKTIHVRCYYDAPISEGDYEFMDSLKTQVGADFCPQCWITVEPVFVGAHEPVVPVGHWAYQREEHEPALVG